MNPAKRKKLARLELLTKKTVEVQEAVAEVVASPSVVAAEEIPVKESVIETVVEAVEATTESAPTTTKKKKSSV
jgi:hypothetical protein